jgi:hypothetical protein
LTRKLSQQGSGNHLKSFLSKMANHAHVLVAPVKHLNTPIPVPSALKRSSLERSITPVGRAAVIPPPKVKSPQVTRTKITPPTRSASQKSETPVIPPEKRMFHSGLATLLKTSPIIACAIFYVLHCYSRCFCKLVVDAANI